MAAVKLGVKRCAVAIKMCAGPPVHFKPHFTASIKFD